LVRLLVLRLLGLVRLLVLRLLGLVRLLMRLLRLAGLVLVWLLGLARVWELVRLSLVAGMDLREIDGVGLARVELAGREEEVGMVGLLGRAGLWVVEMRGLRLAGREH
jgi:hypothetical protein